MAHSGYGIPSKGDRIECRRLGVTRGGCVWYADQLQVLVKWEDGSSSSLVVGRDHFALPTAVTAESSPAERAAA